MAGGPEVTERVALFFDPDHVELEPDVTAVDDDWDDGEGFAGAAHATSLP